MSYLDLLNKIYIIFLYVEGFMISYDLCFCFKDIEILF